MSKPRDSARPSRPSEQAIARRAYELYLQRGSLPGCEVDDWLQAEAQLIAETGALEAASEQPTGQATSEADAREVAADAKRTAPRTRTTTSSRRAMRT